MNLKCRKVYVGLVESSEDTCSSNRPTVRSSIVTPLEGESKNKYRQKGNVSCPDLTTIHELSINNLSISLPRKDFM